MFKWMNWFFASFYDLNYYKLIKIFRLANKIIKKRPINIPFFYNHQNILLNRVYLSLLTLNKYYQHQRILGLEKDKY